MSDVMQGYDMEAAVSQIGKALDCTWYRRCGIWVRFR